MPHPQQVIIKISRFRLLLDASAGLFVPFGIYSLFHWGGWVKFIMALVCIAIGLLTIFANFHELLKFNAPQLIISKNGMQTSNGEFYPWLAISNEKIVEQGQGRYRSYILYFETNDVSRQINVTWLTQSPSKIIAIIELFKQQQN